MMRYAYALAAFAAAGLMLSTGFALADNYMEENTAGGGGWFYVQAMNIQYKDGFALYLDADDYSMSSMQFRAREIPTRVVAYEFSKVSIEDNDMDGYWTAHAWGKAWGAGMDWDFHLKVTDMGKGKMDLFWLQVTLVDDPETVLTWETTGLGGGNIWISPMM